MKALDSFRDDVLSRAFDRAIAGGIPERAELYDRLRRASGLPSPRMNLGLVRAFAGECARRGSAVDGLLAAMLAMHEDVAPHGHVDEIFPILAVAATGARGAKDPSVRRAFVEVLAECAVEPRFRVRDAAAEALAEIGAASGKAFIDVLLSWAHDDDAYRSRAAAATLAHDPLLAAIGSHEARILIDALLQRVENERRAARRNDSFHRLCLELEVTLAAATIRYPEVGDALVLHASSEDEDVRKLLAIAAESLKKHRAHERAKEIEDALQRSKKPLRDPRWGRLPGKRGRGK